MQSLQKGIQLLKVLITVIDTRYQHMTNPDRLTDIRKIFCQIQNIAVAFSRQCAMLFFIINLKIQQDEVCDIHQLLEFIKKVPFTGKRISRRIQNGVNVFLLRLLKQIQKKVNLQQRLSPADRNTAVFAPVAAITHRTLQQCFTVCIRLPAFPGIRIMAILAAHGTAF